MECSIVGWLDKNYRNSDQGLEVYSPDKLKIIEYDYVIVAVKTEKVFHKIEREVIGIVGETVKHKIIGLITDFEKIIKFFV